MVGRHWCHQPTTHVATYCATFMVRCHCSLKNTCKASYRAITQVSNFRHLLFKWLYRRKNWPATRHNCEPPETIYLYFMDILRVSYVLPLSAAYKSNHISLNISSQLSGVVTCSRIKNRSSARICYKSTNNFYEAENSVIDTVFSKAKIFISNKERANQSAFQQIIVITTPNPELHEWHPELNQLNISWITSTTFHIYPSAAYMRQWIGSALVR